MIEITNKVSSLKAHRRTYVPQPGHTVTVEEGDVRDDAGHVEEDRVARRIVAQRP